MSKFNKLSRAEMKSVLGGVVNPDSPGGPGGNNGNPCANGGCTDYGGTISHQSADGSVGAGNCNQTSNPSGCHNFCSNSATGSFWC